jgi:hypothetical protein
MKRITSVMLRFPKYLLRYYFVLQGSKGLLRFSIGPLGKNPLSEPDGPGPDGRDEDRRESEEEVVKNDDKWEGLRYEALARFWPN